MTSHYIDLFSKRAAATSTSPSPSPSNSSSPLGNSETPSSTGTSKLPGAREEECTFCEIVAGEQEAYKVYEDEHVLAFLDILPIRSGHLLVVPKQHYERVSNLSDEISAEIGRALPRVSRALCRAVDQPDFNIVSNQGYAQVVPHVHYHLVPAPRLNDSPPPSSTKRLLFSSRTELEDQDAEKLVRRIREELKKEMDLKEKAKL
ncbi:hypothetical protein JCM5350_002841 [Sporobolomyces pararoseus]